MLRDLLFPRRCIFCRRLSPEGLCDECQTTLPWRLEATEAAAPLFYRGTVRKALHRYKFQGFSGYARVFGTLMAQTVCGTHTNAVTWVPCSRMRRWTRGFDQSKKLAQAVAKELKLPVVSCLIKSRRIRSQTKMQSGAARRENVRGAFSLKTTADIRGKHILLIDDIYTTGATANECRGVLLEGGAAAVTVCCAAAKG